MATSIMQCNDRSEREAINPHAEPSSDAASWRQSHTALKSSIIPPRDIIESIPDTMLYYLHEGLDRPRFKLLRVTDPRLAQVEALLVDRLFPAHDTRSFVKALRIHGQATAKAARLVAEAVGLPPEMAYLCGWLHDMGIASCLRHADEVFPIADAAAFECLEPTITRSEVAHAIRLSTFWRLPSGIRYAIRDHIGFATLTRPILTAAATLIAEFAVSRVAILPHRTALLRPRIIRRAGERLGLGEQALADLLTGIESQLVPFARSTIGRY